MNFRDRVITLAACVVTSCAVTVAMNLYFRGHAVAEEPEKTETVRTKRIEILDADGNQRMVLATSKDSGVPVLALVDANGAVRYSLTMDAKSGGPVQAFNDENGKPRVATTILDDGSGSLVFFDETGKTPIALASTDKGVALNLSDSKGVVRSSLGVEADGTPNLRWFDADGKEVKPK